MDPLFDEGVALPSDLSEDCDNVDCWDVSSCIGIPSGPVTGPALLDVELLGVSPEFALFDPAVDATGIEVGGIVEFMDPIKI